MIIRQTNLRRFPGQLCKPRGYSVMIFQEIIVGSIWNEVFKGWHNSLNDSWQHLPWYIILFLSYKSIVGCKIFKQSKNRQGKNQSLPLPNPIILKSSLLTIQQGLFQHHFTHTKTDRISNVGITTFFCRKLELDKLHIYFFIFQK